MSFCANRFLKVYFHFWPHPDLSLATMSVRYRCRAVGAVGGQMSGAGHSPVGGGRGGGSVPVCVCALFMGHIGYISLKTKNIIVLFFPLSSRFLQKPETTKKNHSLFQLCTLRQRRLICFSASCRLLTLSGLVSPSHAWEKLYPGGSLWTSKPEGCASQYTRIYMNI